MADKTIVITGALNPAGFRGSDAEFNIGTAVGAVQSLPPGVYIAMNGRIWDPAQACARTSPPTVSKPWTEAQKKEPRPKPGFPFVALPLPDQLCEPFRLTPE